MAATGWDSDSGSIEAKELRTMMWNYNVGWAGWLVMSAMMVGFWALVVFAVVALFRGTRSVPPPSPPRTGYNAEQVLDERFARGEIDTDEYHARREVLRSSH
jgi:putative membrane protein